MDARITKTKTKIKDALLDILQTEPIATVSISRICKKANINRNTFYAHYASPEQVLGEIADDLMAQEYGLLDACTSVKQIIMTAIEFTKAYAKENIILLNNGVEKQFINAGITYSKNVRFYAMNDGEKGFAPEYVEMIYTYIVHGSAALLKQWLFSGMKESTAYIGEAMYSITSGLLSGISHNCQGLD